LIDASKYFEKEKNQNFLREEDIDRILKAYKERKDIDSFAHAATLDEIKGNDYNLNIPRYVDTFEKEEDISIKAVAEDLKTTQDELKKADQELVEQLGQLVTDDEDSKEGIQELINLLK
jgi:type I restriction enzyme M protein